MKLVMNANPGGHVHLPTCKFKGMVVVPYEPAVARTREEVVAILAEDDTPWPCLICLPLLRDSVTELRRARRAAISLGVTP